MRIAAHLSVKDEIELIPGVIAHLRSIGVDHIIAVDHESTDGTAEFLESCRGEDFCFETMSDSEPGDSWLDKNLALAKSARADWMLFQDADELWLPATGNLRDCLAGTDADLLCVDRYNVVLADAGACVSWPVTPANHDQLLMFVKPIPDFFNVPLEQQAAPWIVRVPMPKILARPERIGSLDNGMHGAQGVAGAPMASRVPADVVIAHLPFTSRGRFRRKVENIQKLMAMHDDYFGAGMARQWRRWRDIAVQGGIDEEFDRQRLSAEDMRRYRDNGTIRSAREMLHGQGGLDQ